MTCHFLSEDGGEVDEEAVAWKGKGMGGEDEGETD